MPASIAHMLLFEDVISQLESEKGFGELADVLKKHIVYGRLGSVGPDLPYYGILASATLITAVKMAIAKSDLPAGIEKWSGQLHSKDPNIFPLKMMEIAWRETDLEVVEWDDISKKQWAFIMGFLTHIAADQIVHPYVNRIVGQYYRKSENRARHRDCEVYHDVVLFSGKRNKSILDEDLMKWATVDYKDECTEPFFRVFLQKAFVEAHAICPTEKEINDWVYGFLTMLQVKRLSPYQAAAKDYENVKENSELYKKYWLNVGGRPYNEYYKEAVELATLYIKTAYQLFKIDDFEDKHRENFLKVVRNADLTNPLDKRILDDAKVNYSQYIHAVE